jgi:multiple sugar transport system permease protein
MVHEEKKSILGQDKVQGTILLIPAFVYILVLTIYPLGYSLYLSLTNWSLRYPDRSVSFVGLKYYFVLLRDAEFHTSMIITLKFLLIALPLEVLVGLILAMIITHKGMNKTASNIFRTSIILTVVVIPSVAGILWRTIFTPRYGPLNYFLSLLGFPEFPWLSKSNWAFASLIIVELWRYTPLVVLIFVGGLLGIPQDQTESAHLDGCSSLQIFWYIVLPFLKPIFIVVLLLRTMDLFKRFDFIYTLTGGGPGFATQVVNLYVQKMGFEDFEFNIAASGSWVLLLFLLPISLFLIFKLFVPRDF